MKTDFVHVFKGYGRVPSSCYIKMFDDDGDTFICFIDINDGTSVTNASEQIASEIVNEYKLDPDNCRFFETYQQYDYDSFDEIEYIWKKDILGLLWIAKNPQWKPASEELKKIFIE